MCICAYVYIMYVYVFMCVCLKTTTPPSRNKTTTHPVEMCAGILARSHIPY